MSAGNVLRWPAALNIIDAREHLGSTSGTAQPAIASVRNQFNCKAVTAAASRAPAKLAQPGGAITINALTVATLPAAAANPGGIAYVTDSTAIAAEGQNCAGSSTTKALAFSNGTVWKCF
jgi:hypothetical protein